MKCAYSTVCLRAFDHTVVPDVLEKFLFGLLVKYLLRSDRHLFFLWRGQGK